MGGGGKMILRIIDKQTKIWLRDDFIFDEETEIGLEVEPAQGLYRPKWNGESWEEGATQEYIDSLKPEPQELPLEEKNRADIDYLAAMTGVEL